MHISEFSPGIHYLQMRGWFTKMYSVLDHVKEPVLLYIEFWLYNAYNMHTFYVLLWVYRYVLLNHTIYLPMYSKLFRWRYVKCMTDLSQTRNNYKTQGTNRVPTFTAKKTAEKRLSIVQHIIP